MEEACNSVEKVNQAIKKRRREQALKDQQRREIFSQTVQLMEKYGAIKVTAQKSVYCHAWASSFFFGKKPTLTVNTGMGGLCRFGLTDFPDVSIAVAAADEAVDICRQELSARNPTAAKTAAEMAARAVAQMEVVVHRARERHEWELPQRHECADALDGIDKALQVRLAFDFEAQGALSVIVFIFTFFLATRNLSMTSQRTTIFLTKTF